MPMKTLQIRLTEEQIEAINELVKKGKYSSRNDAIRDAVRKMFQRR